jgi:hypothetical protein
MSSEELTGHDPGALIARDLLDNPPIGHSSPGGGGLVWVEDEWLSDYAIVRLGDSAAVTFMAAGIVDEFATLSIKAASWKSNNWPPGTLDERRNAVLPLLLAEAERAVAELRRLVTGETA